VYIDNGGGEPAIGSIMDSMAMFVKVATEGGFEISRQGGDHLLDAIDRFQDWVSDQSHRLRALEQERRLGTSNGANVIGPFTQQVANDDQGFVTQLIALGESLDMARDAIELAMESYRRTEEANLKNFKS
jgi:hypothetical protein